MGGVIERLVKNLGEHAASLVPIQGLPTIDEQERRWATPEFGLYRLGLEAQAEHSDLAFTVERLRGELIEVRKELSRLKRAK